MEKREKKTKQKFNIIVLVLKMSELISLCLNIFVNLIIVSLLKLITPAHVYIIVIIIIIFILKVIFALCKCF